MTQIKTQKIPQRIECINKEHPFATGAKDIYDDNLEKPQSEVNQDRIEDIAAEVQRAQGAESILDGKVSTEKQRAQQAESTLDGKIAAEKQRAEGVEGGLDERLGTVEQLAEISIGGGDAQIATGADFTNPDATKRAKVPTVGAIVDGLNDGIYDVSKRNPTAGPNSDGKFTLEYILNNADTLIPTGWRHGGMTISFVQSSDNKYIQARCMAQNFTTDVTQWQGVDDVPTAVSDNLVKSGGVFGSIIQYTTLIKYNELIANKGFGNDGKLSSDNPKRFANLVLIPILSNNGFVLNVKSKTGVKYLVQASYYNLPVDPTSNSRVDFEAGYSTTPCVINTEYNYVCIMGKREDDEDVDISDVIIEYGNKDEATVIALNSSDYTAQRWFTGTEIGGDVEETQAPYINIYSIIINVHGGEKVTFLSAGGASGRAWYQLDENKKILLCAEENFKGKSSFYLNENTKYLIIQTNDGILYCQAFIETNVKDIYNNVQKIGIKVGQIESDVSIIKGAIKNQYKIEDYSSVWMKGETIGETLTILSPHPSNTYSKIINVRGGERIKINCAGGASGRAWYQLDINKCIISMAEPSVTGTFEFVLDNNARYFVAQSNNQNYIGFEIIIDDLVGTINKRYELLSGKRLSILGDSISTFGTPNQSNSTGLWTYVGNLCTYPSETLFQDVQYCYWHRLLERYNMILGINESFRGTRVSWDGVTESANQGANKYIGSMHRINHLDDNGIPDIIMVFAGTNDIGASVPIGTFNTESPINYTDEQIASLPVNTFADAYRTLMIRLQKYYTTSRIIVLLPNFTDTYYTVPSLDNYLEVIKEICDYFGVQYIDLRTAGITMFNRSIYLPDGIHPNAAGHKLLYQLLCRNCFDELNNVGT